MKPLNIGGIDGKIGIDANRTGKALAGPALGFGRGMQRRKANTGVFSDLEVPMQKREVERICREYGIDISGLKIKIQRDAGLLNLDFAGSTAYDDIGRIDIFPNAFADIEQLLRTVIHEKAHVMQLKKYGRHHAQSNIDFMEKIAARFERLFYGIASKKEMRKMKLYDKWLHTLSQYAGGKNSACPVCGSKNLEHGYVIIDREKRQGYGALWCKDCMHGFQLSRVAIKANSDENKIISALPTGLIFP